tara:strand:+ start:1402 stop:2268 length:867 start_codon:yes stop_codon:yes gene_type:complete
MKITFKDNMDNTSSIKKSPKKKQVSKVEQEKKISYLSKINMHKKDKDIFLNEKNHVYDVNGNKKITSVTKWVHSHFEQFNPDKVIDKMMSSEKWPGNKYFGKTKDEIKKEWKYSGIEAAKQGTKLHYDIECYYNQEKINKHPENKSLEYSYFKNFAEANSGLVPYRTEMKIYNKELQLAGSIDMIFKNDDNTYSIYDWKRCKDITERSFGGKSSHTKCIEHIPDSNFWHYTLQLNTYKNILELDYDMMIKDMYLVCLHPNKSNYEVIKVPNLKTELDSLFNLRKSLLV